MWEKGLGIDQPPPAFRRMFKRLLGASKAALCSALISAARIERRLLVELSIPHSRALTGMARLLVPFGESPDEIERGGVNLTTPLGDLLKQNAAVAVE